MCVFDSTFSLTFQMQVSFTKSPLCFWNILEKLQYSTSICFNVIFLSAKQNNARAVKSRVPQYWYPHMSRKLRQSVPSFTAMTLTGIKSCLYIGRQATALNYRLHSLHCAQKESQDGTVLGTDPVGLTSQPSEIWISWLAEKCIVSIYSWLQYLE